jgi:hypothetical protein
VHVGAIPPDGSGAYPAMEQTSGDVCSNEPHDSKESGTLSFAWTPYHIEQSLLFNVEINLRCRPVFDYLLAVQFHF